MDIDQISYQAKGEVAPYLVRNFMPFHLGRIPGVIQAAAFFIMLHKLGLEDGDHGVGFQVHVKGSSLIIKKLEPREKDDGDDSNVRTRRLQVQQGR